MSRLTIRNSDGSVSQPTDLKWAEALEKLADFEDDEQKKAKGCGYCNRGIKRVVIELEQNDEPGSPERLNPIRFPIYCPICGRKVGE